MSITQDMTVRRLGILYRLHVLLVPLL